MGQHRRFARALGPHPPQRPGPPGARRRGGLRAPQDRVAAPLQGRRHGGPRGLRVRHRPGQLQRHQGGRRDRDLRDAGEAARLTAGAGARTGPRLPRPTL
ncbi:hypothetical protein MICRO11B_720008 [Micrococcus luteus]|nr:hypothetical protein MICRO11B_720008 [Micrococcus luteus]